MKTFHLINIKDKEICDVYAKNLKEAQRVASEFLGGKPADYIERF